MTGYLNAAQVGKLLEPINPQRVGEDGKGFSHVQAYELRAMMTRIFGFARWSEEVTDQAPIYEADNNNRWTVAYRSRVRLTVCAPDGTVLAVYEEGATGEAKNQPSRGDAHDLALKTSQSQAFKRAAANLGDAFGLSLYGKGSLKPLVFRTLVGTGEQQVSRNVDAHITEQLAPEDSPAGPAEEAPVSAAPARQADDPVTEIREKALTSARKRDVMRLIDQATRQSLGGAMTTDADGNGVLLDKLLTDRLAKVPA